MTDQSAVSDPSQAPSIQDYLENALFGGPISQTAPELSALADSSSMGGMDYSFYNDPGGSLSSYQSPQAGDTYSDFFNQMTPPVDLSMFDTSDADPSLFG